MTNSDANVMIRSDGDAVLVVIEGEIDLSNADAVAQQVSTALSNYTMRAVLDLSKVTYIDSSGLAVLIEAMQNVSHYGGQFALSGLQEGVRPIFEIARLDQVFRIFPNTVAALGA
jgi:anti-sigma B factor antagonist